MEPTSRRCDLAEDERYQTRFASSLKAKAVTNLTQVCWLLVGFFVSKKVAKFRDMSYIYIYINLPKFLGGHKNTHHREKRFILENTGISGSTYLIEYVSHDV